MDCGNCMKINKAKEIQVTVEECKRRILRKVKQMSVYRDVVHKFFAKSYVLTLFSQYKSKKPLMEPVAVVETSSESKPVKANLIPSPPNKQSKIDMMKDKDFINYLALHCDTSEHQSDIKKVLTAHNLYLHCLSSINKDYKVILDNVKSLVSLRQD